MSQIKTKFIADSQVTNAKLANLANNTVKANKSGSSAAPSDLALSDVAETGSSIFTITNGSKTVVSASNLTIQANLTSANIYVGNGSNVPVGVSVTGDIAITNAGVVTVSKVNGVSYPSSPGTNTVPVVTSSNTITYEQVPVAAGGTAATTASDARTNLGLAIGTDVQAFDAQLSSLVRQNSQSAAYTTVLTDGGKHILHPSADTTARTFTIDSNANVAYPIGTVLTFVNQHSAGVLTIAITTDTMRLAGAGTTGSRTLAADGIATALKITSTEWIISGTGLT